MISFLLLIGHMGKKMGLIENGGLDDDDQFISPNGTGWYGTLPTYFTLPSCLGRAKIVTGKTGRRPILRRRRHHTRCRSKSLMKALDAQIMPCLFRFVRHHACSRKKRRTKNISLQQKKCGLPGTARNCASFYSRVLGTE